MRLTKSTVEGIARKVVKHRFSADVLAIRCAEAELFHEAWKAPYTKAERDFLTGAPAGFVCDTAVFDTRIGGQRHKLYAQGSFYGELSYAITADDREKLKLLPATARCSVRHSHGASDDKLTFAADDKGLPAAILALALKKSDLITAIKEADAKVVAALTGTTRAKAIILWPEIEPFLPEENKPAGLPALPVKELNALLDLPVAEAA